MSNLADVLNELLKSHNARPIANTPFSLQHIDEFLKEAYRINSHIASLNNYLKEIRQSYLSTAPPPRRAYAAARNSQFKYLTDRQKEEIDAETKGLLRELNAGILNLANAEQLRQNAETTITRNKYARLGMRAIGAWAAGGAGHMKSYEQELDEAKAGTISMHRESVLWYLRQKILDCGNLQASMMEKRIQRVVEKNRSVLAKSRSEPRSDFSFNESPGPSTYNTNILAPHIEAPVFKPEEELTPEQIQMFEKENQDMLKHYESTLDQVKTAEKSLVEISELQTQLVNNLAVQSEHIDQLVADSFRTTENIGGGNKELKKAAERKSTAKYVFYLSCGLSLSLIVWDLLI